LEVAEERLQRLAVGGFAEGISSPIQRLAERLEGGGKLLAESFEFDTEWFDRHRFYFYWV
jgi:hypothetical protein